MVDTNRIHDRLNAFLEEVRRLAVEYYKITGKPLGVTGEIAEYEASRLLNLTLAGPRESGYDATRSGNTARRKVQKKGRRFAEKKPNPGARVGKIDLTKSGIR
ncbi:MAG: hypothetical protein O3A47_07545 [Chloroflexi bacterium]|nr:hypothetical protein [Chloroflexota bacterium]